MFGTCYEKEGREVGCNTMNRVAAGAHLPTPWLFVSAKRPDDRADYCLAAVSSPSATTEYSFLHLSGLERALWANSDEGSAQ